CRRGEIAQALHEGILSYFDGNEPTPTPEPVGYLHVSAIEMWVQQKGPKDFLSTHVTIRDSNEIPVSGAEVSIITTKPDGSEISSANITKDDGTITFKLVVNQSGTYESRVTFVSKDGWVYDEEVNDETTETLTLP
ncbi:MAG: Ig-like domain-containing protein, partial [Anaerolineales bacterium]|nr:Ig-like domain-containing protein [Anaerolineales bacterium]